MGEPRGRVLVVDDSEDDHLQIRRLLREEVFDVHRAYTGAEALERLSLETFDALVTDQKMPRLSGDALIARARTIPHNRALRCILLSGRTSDEQLVAILKEGQVFRYFEKDRVLLSEEGRAEFRVAVRNAIESCRLEREREALNQRLRSQVDALDGQYRLLRTLVDLKDPTQVLRLVVESLARRIACRAVLGLVDLRPDQRCFGHLQQGDTPLRLTHAEAEGWWRYAAEEYDRLSGRAIGGVLDVTAEPPLMDDAPGRVPAGGEVAALPVFISRDLRGLVLVVRPEHAPLADDERALFRVWRDQLQDALTRVHTQLLDEQRRIELMVESMTEGVVLTDEEGAVTLMNPVARRLLGAHIGERPDFTVIVGALGLSSLEVLRQLGMGEGRVAWRELQREEQFYQVLFSKVRDHAGAFVGILTVIRDVTDDKLAEQRREEFVHIIGHELRSPLTSIGGILDLMSKQVLGEMSARQREYIEMARDSCVKINHILNDLLDLAKFEKGKMPLALETVNLEQVVRDAVRKFEALAIDRRIRLDFECLMEGLFLQADAHRLAQVVNNLLSNAIKYTTEGGRVTVTVFAAFSAPSLYLVSVHNSGEEICEADLDRVFDKFEQVGPPDRRTLGGTGLGLSICRNIVHGHHGDIWVESGRGQGTRFVFTLPCGGTATPHSEPEPDRGADRPALLLVGDDVHEMLGLKGVLLALGHRVRLCEPEVGAIRDRIASHRPTLALFLEVDAGLDGEALAELASHNDLPVVGVLPPGTAIPATLDTVVELPPEPLVLSSLINVTLARHRRHRRLRVLLVGPRVDTFAGALEDAGYLSYSAIDAEVGLRRLDTLLPDLVLVDLALANARTVVDRLADSGAAPSLYLLAEGQKAPVGSEAAVHLAAEIDTRGLLVAVRARLTRQRRAFTDALLVLPGARELQRDVQARIRNQEAFAYVALDIAGLREAVEAHGFMWGHAAMAHIAEMVHAALRAHADERAFLGHLREDDFVLLVTPGVVPQLCDALNRGFQRIEPVLHADENHAARLALRLTVVMDEGGRFDRYASLQTCMANLRARSEGPNVLVDRAATAVVPRPAP